MRVHAVQLAYVQREAARVGQRLHELVHKLGVEVPDALRRYLGAVAQAGASAEVYGAEDKRLVHRCEHRAVALDALFVAQRGLQRLAERQTHVLDGVVTVDVQVALTSQLQPHAAVAGELLQHVVKEAQPGGYAGSASVQAERERDVGLVGFSCDGRSTHGITRFLRIVQRTEKRSMVLSLSGSVRWALFRYISR